MKTAISSEGVRHQTRITLTLNADMMEQVKKESSMKAMPVSTWVRAALADYLQSRVSDTVVKPADVML